MENTGRNLIAEDEAPRDAEEAPAITPLISRTRASPAAPRTPVSDEADDEDVEDLWNNVPI